MVDLDDTIVFFQKLAAEYSSYCRHVCDDVASHKNRDQNIAVQGTEVERVKAKTFYEAARFLYDLKYRDGVVS